ncbi:MAG: hypothetical protein ABW164_07260 [Sphingobium sp.]
MRRRQDRIIVGNWADPQLLAGERFDTVLADYLVGAVEGFAPYFQARLFRRLRALTGGRLYLVGLEPYVTLASDTAAGRMIWEIGRFRDAVLLHAGDLVYREFPSEWVLEQLTAARFRVTAVHHFPIRYGARFIDSQIDMCASRSARLNDRTLADALHARGEALRHEALALASREGGVRHGFDYVIAAEPC